MRLLRQLPQLPQNAVSYSNPSRDPAVYVLILHLGRIGALQPLRDLFVAKPPLPAELDGGYLLTLGPQTNGASGHTQPPCNGRRGKKGF